MPDAPSDVPRIRTLKPDHKTHRKVGHLVDRVYRLWVGMITEADDEGRLVADPEQLRALIFPYHRIRPDQIEAGLAELHRLGLIRRYAIDGTAYADFPSWTEHQRISHPADSVLPTFREGSGILLNPPEDSSSRARGVDGKGREGSGRDKISPRPSAEEPSWPSPEALVSLYNAETPDECPAVTKLSPARRKKAQAALAAFPDRAWWVALLRRVKSSRFLRGLKPQPGHEHFRADFDWLLAKGKDGTENAVKVAEGKYDG